MTIKREHIYNVLAIIIACLITLIVGMVWFPFSQ